MRTPTTTRTRLRLAHLGFAACVGVVPGTAGASPEQPTEPAPAPAQVAGKRQNKALAWLTAVTPRRHMFEPGVFGGLWLPSRALELHDRNVPFVQYERVASELGLRLGYFPLRHFGFEGELAMMPGRTITDQRAFVSSARAHGIVQLGLSRLVPFAMLGGGVLSVRSGSLGAGNDADQAFIVGGGVKLMLTPHVVLRLDVRDVMSPKRGIRVSDPADSLEVLVGFSLALGPRAKKAARPELPPDADGDGVLGSADACPQVAARTKDGCPIPDGDGDSVGDAVDQCPKEAGVAPDGCPIRDTDDDGVLDPDDACPEQAATTPDGCPIRDDDGDGLLAPEDACPTEPETPNGWDDADGCPDELPAEVQSFVGVLEGIDFASGRATIRPTSKPKLDEAVKILEQFPDLRVRISGHTDDKGSREKNLELSAARAEAVKQYMVDAGIDASRIETRGVGPDEPLADNTDRAGRQRNRRIEFEVITPAADRPVPTAAPSPDTASEPEPAPEPPPDAAPAGQAG